MTNLFITLIVSQGLFAKTYGGTNDDVAYPIIRAADGGYLITGGTSSFGAGNMDLLTLKLASDGSIAWARTFGGSNEDLGLSIIQAADGGYAIAGWTTSFGAGNYDILVLKLAPDASLSWAKTFGGTDREYCHSIIQTADGGYVIPGRTKSFGSGIFDLLVLKLLPDGSLSWAKIFGGLDLDLAQSIVQTPDGGFVIAGSTRSFGAGGYDIVVLKMAPDGSLMWVKTYGGPSDDFVESITQTQDGGFAVAARTLSFGAGSYDFLMLKLASDGSVNWAKTLGGTNEDHGYSVIQTTDGGYAVTGFTKSFGAGGYDILAVKLAPDGSLSWARTFGGPGNDYVEYARSIIQSADGDYAIVGRTQSFGADNYDVLLLKIGRDGNYPGCVQDCFPTVSSPALTTSSPSGSTSCSPVTGSPTLAVNSPVLTITDPCEALFEHTEEIGVNQQPPITCSLVPGAMLFLSALDVPLRIYTADGRLAYSGQLKKGENRIDLDKGAYIWMADAYRGKAVIR